MFGAYVRENRKVVIALTVYTAVFALIFWLYRLPLGAVGYAALVCLFLLLVWFAVDYRRFAARLRLLRRLEQKLKEQTEEHNGGSYWIGTRGYSNFGNSGHSQQGGEEAFGHGLHRLDSFRCKTVCGESPRVSLGCPPRAGLCGRRRGLVPDIRTAGAKNCILSRRWMKYFMGWVVLQHHCFQVAVVDGGGKDDLGAGGAQLLEL